MTLQVAAEPSAGILAGLARAGMGYTILSGDPLVIHIPNFVTPRQARRAIALGEKHIARSRVVCNTPGGCIDQARTSSTAYLPTDKTLEPVRVLARRLSGYENVEALQLVKYTPGQEFKPHLDAFDEQTVQGKREILTGGQRAATFFCYLQAPAGGGATVFPTLALSVPPTPYAAVYWESFDGGVKDQRVLHGGAPVTAGVKYGLNVWLRFSRAAVGRFQLSAQLSP